MDKLHQLTAFPHTFLLYAGVTLSCVGLIFQQLVPAFSPKPPEQRCGFCTAGTESATHFLVLLGVWISLKGIQTCELTKLYTESGPPTQALVHRSPTIAPGRPDWKSERVVENERD